MAPPDRLLPEKRGTAEIGQLTRLRQNPDLRGRNQTARFQGEPCPSHCANDDRIPTVLPQTFKRAATNPRSAITAFATWLRFKDVVIGSQID